MAPRLDHALIVRPSRPQQRLTLRLDADLIAWLKAQGQGYQARMNAVLRANLERAQTDALSRPACLGGLADLREGRIAAPPDDQGGQSAVSGRRRGQRSLLGGPSPATMVSDASQAYQT